MTSAFRHRLGAMVLKELIQMRRDRLTFAMMLGIPVMQLLLFGYAINTNPRELPTAVIAADHGVEARAFLAALTNTGYFRITRWPAGPAEMDRLLARSEEHTSELQSLMRISYAVFCLKKKKNK